MIAVVAVAVLGASHVGALGQDAVGPPAGGLQALISQAKGRGAGTAQRKVTSRLRSVLAELAARGITRANARARNAEGLSSPLVKVDQDARLQVYFHLSAFGEAQLAQLRRIEAEIEIADEELGIVQGWIPFDRMEEAAALPFVDRVTAPKYATIRAGSKTTEGDAILLADQLRDLGVDGTGVKVGVISSGTFGLPAAQASGDLPAGITQFGSCDEINWGTILCAEGTAMLEIVHDIAPGAQLGFGAVSTDVEFRLRVDQLVDNFGAHVVVDDLGFLGQPYFEDGSVAQKVQSRTGQAVYVSSAGNSADGHYEGNFVSHPVILAGVPFDAHNFGGGDFTMDLRIQPGGAVLVWLQWNDQFGSSANDYDLWIGNSALTDALCPTTCASLGIQDGSQDPIEAVFYENTTPFLVTGRLFVDRFAGAARRLEMFVLELNATHEHNVPAGSVFGHAAVPGAVAVAAIGAADPGNDTIQSYSSRGPSNVYFPSFQSRPKPDITGIDGVSITGAGGFPNPFFGTSAAAPHVAGIAALLRAADRGATPAQVIAALKSGAVDLGAAGPDSVFGAGRADALAASEKLGFPFDTVSACSEFNADGKADILWRNTLDGRTAIWLMNGLSLDRGGGIGQPPLAWRVEDTGHFNNDGFSDILWRHEDGRTVIWRMNGFRLLGASQIGVVDPVWAVKGVGDFNGDGLDEILWRHLGDGSTVIWRTDGFTLLLGALVGRPPLEWRIVGVADFNADDRSDIVWQNVVDGRTVVWEMNGFVLDRGVTLGRPPVAWKVEGVGNFNGLGQPDILWRHAVDNRTVIWQMAGNTLQDSAGFGSVDKDWKVACLGDHNGDLKADILWQHVDGRTAIWQMNGLVLDRFRTIAVVPDWKVQ